MNENQRLTLELTKAIKKICYENNIWFSLDGGSILGAVRHKGFIPWDTDMDIYIKITDVEKFCRLMDEKLPCDMKLFRRDKELKLTHALNIVGYKDIPLIDAHVDIFPIIGVPINETKRKLFVWYCFNIVRFLHCKHLKREFCSSKKMLYFVKPIAKLFPDKYIEKVYYYLEHRYDFEHSEYFYTIATGYAHKGCMDKNIILETFETHFEDTMLPIPKKYDNYLTRLYGSDYMTPKSKFNKR